MPRRSAWSALADDWDPDNPAIVRMRDALALEPVSDAPEAPQDARLSVEPVLVAQPAKRERIGALVGRVKAGDLSAVAALRELLGG